uniref:Uncharacterized protein n=1 Tax=Rhizophora mucronata TaxID=61149 RepID=A0A2P2NC80_RHIMU
MVRDQHYEDLQCLCTVLI